MPTGTGTAIRREAERFVSEEPIGYAGGINVYGYANGNPVSDVDLIGLAACNVLFPSRGLLACQSLVPIPCMPIRSSTSIACSARSG
ncbi:hypothetical protein FOZ70_22675 [Burkholderia sp. COPS]|nr:hypothetical protein [Burkholderia sp. COPS]